MKKLRTLRWRGGGGVADISLKKQKETFGAGQRRGRGGLQEVLGR